MPNDEDRDDGFAILFIVVVMVIALVGLFHDYFPLFSPSIGSFSL